MQPLIEILRRDWPVHRWARAPQLLAVSGGADSVALLCAMTELSPNRELLCVAHFNHGWRGAESDADEAFVVDLCRSFGLRLEIGRAQQVGCHPIVANHALLDSNTDTAGDTASHLASETTRGYPTVVPKTEEHARKVRYQFLNRIASKFDIEYVLTAHTASDRVETLLHNLCRGTGLAGACSPTLVRKMRSGITLVRPLIGCFRWQVNQFLSDLRQPFRSDASNADQSYRRNFLRASVLPRLREAYGSQVDQRLLSFSQIVEETLLSQHQQAEDYWRQAVTLSQSPTEIKKMKATKMDAVLLPSEDLLPTTWSIVQISLAKQWQDRGWPQKSLSRRHWELVRRYWKSGLTAHQETSIPAKPRVMLPGPVRMEYRKGWIVLEQL